MKSNLYNIDHNPFWASLRGKLKIAFRILFKGDRYAAIIFDKERLPTPGDSITVGGKVRAVFKKI